MSNWASGNYGWSICDICGWRTPYNERKESSYKTFRCCDCDDGQFDLKNHPQNKIPPVQPDPQALKNPRPDVPLNPNRYDDPQRIPIDPGDTPA